VNTTVDIEYDFRTNSKSGDPDGDSTVLYNYHQILWSKKLPTNKYFALRFFVDDYGNNKLISETYQESHLSSDTMTTGYIKWTSRGMSEIIKKIPQREIDEFSKILYTIGNFIVFPSNQIDRKRTINGDRGCNPAIADRFDLTLECIRLYYNNKTGLGIINPLGETIKRYESFFNLFKNFRGYCEFFLLQDLALDNYTKVNYFLPFDDFSSVYHACPTTIDEYNNFKMNVTTFIENRNNRIRDYVNSIL